MKQKWKRPLELLLSVAMLFSMSSTLVYAADVETGTSAVCPHHVHDETCGYSESAPCTFDSADCELCNSVDSGDPGECICHTLCTEDSIRSNCPVCGAEGTDLVSCTGEVPALLADGPTALVVGGTTVVENSQTTGTGWSYANGVLMLDNATITGTSSTSYGAAIYAAADLTIELKAAAPSQALLRVIILPSAYSMSPVL